jgi:hypothetical protein
MSDMMLGITMGEYQAIESRLISYKAEPQSGIMDRPGSMYSVDSMGRVWGRMVDGSGIYLLNDARQQPVERIAGQINPLWRAEADE